MNTTSYFNDSERQFVNKAEKYCSESEQCRSSVKDKLAGWGADRELATRIVDYLVDNEFIDEARYCRIFCESKLHLQKWGRVKMNYQLRMKQIERSLIDEALNNLDEAQYRETLLQLAQSKMLTIKDADPRKKQSKLVSYLASHGFTADEINDTIEKLQ